MSEKDILGAFLLVNNPIVLSEEEIKDVQKAIKQLQQENKQLKDNWNKLKEYIDIKLYNVEYLQNLCGCRIDDETHMILDIIKEEMQEIEQGSDKE